MQLSLIGSMVTVITLFWDQLKPFLAIHSVNSLWELFLVTLFLTPVFAIKRTELGRLARVYYKTLTAVLSVTFSFLIVLEAAVLLQGTGLIGLATVTAFYGGLAAFSWAVLNYGKMPNAAKEGLSARPPPMGMYACVSSWFRR